MRPQGVPEQRHPHLAMSHPALKVSPRPRVEALSISPVMSFCSPSHGGTSQTLNTVPTPAHAHPSLRTRHSPSTAAIRVCETGGLTHGSVLVGTYALWASLPWVWGLQPSQGPWHLWALPLGGHYTAL